MKALSPRLCRLAADILSATLVDGQPLDRSFSRSLSAAKLSPFAQGRLVDMVNDICRRMNYYQAVTGCRGELRKPDMLKLVGGWHLANELELPEMGGVKPNLNGVPFVQVKQEADQQATLVDGCPAWLEQLGQAQLGERWPAQRAALAQRPERFIRVNTLKTDLPGLRKALFEEKVKAAPVEGVDTALKVFSDSHLFRTACYRDGWFEQQDAGSQQVAPLLGVAPGMLVVDACAGAGGKTLQLAALMQNKGRLVAMDIEQRKLDALRSRARRAGVFNLETRLIESAATLKRLRGKADRLLLDVPCSGSGVLKRNPEGKWRSQEESLDALLDTQRRILENYSRMLKVGGELVYATCSLWPVENELQVQRFLSECGGEFEFLEERHLMPDVGFDGFYMARLRRCK